MHILNEITKQAFTLNKKIVDYKLKIIEHLNESTLKQIYLISINEKNANLKIETRETLNSECINDLENTFQLQLINTNRVAVETQELYYYIFKPQGSLME